MSDANPFAAPAEAAGFTPKDHNGRLLLIEPLSVETDIKTDYGLTDAVAADVAVLDGPDAPERYDNALIFPVVLQSQLKSKIGEKVLGRLGQGEAKPGQSPPWKLAPATEDDIQTGKRYLTYRDDQKEKVKQAAADMTGSAGEASTPF